MATRSASPAVLGRAIRSRVRTLFAHLAPATLGEFAEIALFVVVVAGVVASGYLQGAVALVVSLPALIGGGDVVILQAIVGVFTLSGTLALSGILLFGQIAGEPTDDLPTTGPTVTAIVPVAGDARVLHRSVESLLASRYEDLRVLVVTEPGDESSLSQARTLSRQHPGVDVLVNTGRPGSKAGAVNHAAAVTESPLLAVFDADERVHPCFVSAAVSRLSDADVVQGRTIPEPDGFVESLAYYESVVLGDLPKRILTLLTGFSVAASRTVVMRRTAFERVEGYDPRMLTEDYAFAFACYEANLDVVERLGHTSAIEAAHTPRDWWGQRKRWMIGYAQVLHSLVAGAGSPRNYRSLLAPAMCAGSVLGNLFMLSVVSKAAVLLVNDAWSWLVVLLLVLGACGAALRIYDVYCGPLQSVGLGWLAAPLVLPLYSVVAIKGLVEYVFTWEGEWYSVTKRG